MKSRWTTWVLLAAVAVIWGAVARMILTASHGDVKPGSRANATAAAPASFAADTLRCDYPDPFTKGYAANARTTGARQVLRRLPQQPKPERRAMIRAEHLGTIRVQNRILHILMLDGQQYELRCGDPAGDFVLKKADADSLYLERDGSVYGVKKCE